MWNFNAFKNQTAVIEEDGEERSYEWLEKQSAALAEAVTLGRCLVFCLCTNTIGSLIGYTAFINRRMVPLLLDAELDGDMLAHLIKVYQPDYLWIPEEQRVSFSDSQAVYFAEHYIPLKTPYTRVFPLFDELALLLTTSGSTGSPKLVRQSYRNIKANTESIIAYLGIDRQERAITTLPMSYTYGLSIINTHLYAGASIILTRNTVMQREFWKQMKDLKATSISGVPYTYQMLEKLRFFTMTLPSLRTMTQAGGKLAPELHLKFAEYALNTGRRFIVMYGQTEATARMAYLPHEEALRKVGSMGIAIPGGRLSIIDASEKLIEAPEVTGELVYEGENVTLGYATEGKDLVNGDERNGRLVTGDMAKRDADGFYYIVGRKKRFLKVFGSRINLDETEGMIKTRFPEADCACAGTDDHLYVFVTVKDIENDVIRFLAEKTGQNRIAFNVKYLDAVPKNPAGKTLYTELEKYYQSETDE